MTSLASISINYQNYRMIMPDYSGRFFLMHAQHFVEAHDVYTILNERLISALTREHNAAVRVNGSFSASWIWNTVRIALPYEVSDGASCTMQKMTHERSKADGTLSVFLTSEATKLSHESLYLAKEGETFGGTQSYGNGKTAPVMRYRPLSVPTVSHASIIR